jgi:hypothetical protein
VRYVGTNPNLLKQYAGILEIFEVSGETYTCLKPDGKLTSWIEFEDLKRESPKKSSPRSI